MHTKTSLKKDFERLGIKSGMTLLVHTSLKSIGDVCGGPVAVILALEELLAEQGTLVMPTFNSGLTDPARWTSPPASQEQVQTILAEMPPYDPHLTPTQKMGFVSETFRKQAGVIRSPHPHTSFAAWGHKAEFICSQHPLNEGLGEESPLAKIYELQGHVLLIGVNHDRNTSMHLAEYHSRPNQTRIIEKAPMVVDGVRKWVEFDEIDLDNTDFMKIGEDFEKKTEQVKCGKIGDAQAKLIPQAPLVDYAKSFMSHQGVEPDSNC